MATAELTTECYIERDGCYLMLHRTKKERDINKGKWIGVGGHFEADESPEECLLREVREETGLTLARYRPRAILTFVFDDGTPTIYTHLYTADAFTGELTDCDEGELAWIDKNRLDEIPLWDGDRLFLRLLAEERPYFSIKYEYHGDVLLRATLDGEEVGGKE